MSKKVDDPWMEKYRPKNLSEILSQKIAIKILSNTLDTGELPHLLMYGKPGTGKTSSILALCNQLFGPLRVRERVLELNASDERGINIVRNKIINFAKITVGTVDKKYMCPPYKIIILDEADAMTSEAQSALRKVMEEYALITRFCFICNYENKIIEPIKSRCVKIKFCPIKNKHIVEQLQKISIAEKVKIDVDAINTLAKISGGDLRRAILNLQNVKYINLDEEKDASSTDIQLMCKHMELCTFTKYIDLLKSCKTFEDITDFVKKLHNHGWIINSIFSACVLYIINLTDILDKNKASMFFTLSEIEKKINDGGNEYLQLLKLFNHLYMLISCETL